MTEGNGRRTRAEDPPRLPEVQEGQASPEVRALFDDIIRTLRVPFVGLFWRVLAADPPVLRLAWEAVAPNLRTWAAERAADRLRARALIAEAAGISSHKAFKGDLVRAEIDYDLRTRIANFNHIALYALPKHLLAVTMLSEALEGRPVGGAGGQVSTIPLGVAPGAVPVAPLDPGAARGRAAELLPDIAAGHGHPVVEDYYRSLARLPDYLGAAWNAIRPVVRDEEYDARGAELRRMAIEAVRTLPYPVSFPGGRLRPPQVGELAQVLRLFRDRILPDALIDAALITALTDGPEAAGRIPYTLEPE
jgi:hypothetical protein